MRMNAIAGIRPTSANTANNGTAPAGLDMLSDYSGFIPLGNFGLQPDNRRPEPETFDRYSDAQLFALAKFIYSLAPPVNHPDRRSVIGTRK